MSYRVFCNLQRYRVYGMRCVQDQQTQVRQLQDRLPDLSRSLDSVGEVDTECKGANVEENDYTVFTFQDLAFELELVVQSIHKKITFIDNQVHSMILPHGWST